MVESISPADLKKRRRLILSSYLGNLIEWYDFGIYAYLGTAVFDKIFFPKMSAAAGLVAVMGLFAVGFIARPLGALLFGYFGDRVGRKPMMVMALTLMGVAAVLMGLCPTYSQIGLAAPVLMMILRFTQGLAIGGESSGGPLLALESTPSERRGYFASLVWSGAAAAVILSSSSSLLVSMLPVHDMLTWGWRIPYLASSVAIVVAVYMQRSIDESPIFLAAIAKAAPSKAPVVDVIRNEGKSLVIVILCAAAALACIYLLGTFGFSYAVATLHLNRTAMLGGVLAGGVIHQFATPLAGHVSDKIGRRTVMATCFVAAVLYGFLEYFVLLPSGSLFLAAMGIALANGILTGSIGAMEVSFYSELFRDTRLRFTGSALGKQTGSAIGGLLPLAAAGLLSMNGSVLLSIMVPLILFCIVGLGAIFWAEETHKLSLEHG
ncbi:MAG TPA: MFS transporter [Rhizomicrobium sp.]|jgi:MFS family permease|nr:MFS transporter [Rhizomicrobium sp.]